LARLIGESTGELEKVCGPTVGALLNASFGNAAELIIALSAIRAPNRACPTPERGSETVWLA